MYANDGMIRSGRLFTIPVNLSALFNATPAESWSARQSGLRNELTADKMGPDSDPRQVQEVPRGRSERRNRRTSESPPQPSEMLKTIQKQKQPPGVLIMRRRERSRERVAGERARGRAELQETLTRLRSQRKPVCKDVFLHGEVEQRDSETEVREVDPNDATALPRGRSRQRRKENNGREEGE